LEILPCQIPERQKIGTRARRRLGRAPIRIVVQPRGILDPLRRTFRDRLPFLSTQFSFEHTAFSRAFLRISNSGIGLVSLLGVPLAPRQQVKWAANGLVAIISP